MESFKVFVSAQMISVHIPLLQLVFLTSTLMMLFACSTISAQAAAGTTSAPVQLAFEVLSSFKQAITSDPNQALASWNTSNNSNPCTSNWNGISCEFLSPNTTDFITGISINLTGLSLGGTLTPNLTRLTVLTYLDLTLNEISGTFTFLSNFSSIRSLQYLSFARNKFYGAFTLPTSCFPNLLFLSVAENKLSGSIPYDELMRCSSLQSLNVSNNHFTGSFFPSGLGPNLTSTLRSIDAGINGLTGSIPESIGNCSDLTFLSFPSNNFSGEFPASIGRGCPKLSFLSLFNNNMTGSIPKEFGLLSQLSYISIGLNNFSGQIFNLVLNCTNLTTLDISRMSITGRMPDDLGLRLPNLMFLNLEQNMLTGSIPASLGNCSKLINLLVGFNDNMTGSIPPSLFRANSIINLDLQHNLFDGAIPHEIGNLTSVQKAYLNNNNFNGSLPKELSLLASIQSFALQSNSLIGNFPNQFFNCGELIGLSLYDNNFVGSVSSSIRNLTKLNYLDFSNNHLTGELPSGIANCTELQVIRLTDNMLGGSIPDSIVASLTACTILNLARNNFSGQMPNNGFRLMASLQNLDLSYNRLSGLVPSSLEDCKDLRALNLSNNLLVGSIPPEFGTALVALTDLILSHNSINNSIPQELGGLGSLERLDMSYNALAGPIPSSLSDLKNLTFLNLSYNSKLQGLIPAGGIFGRLTGTAFIGDPLVCGAAVGRSCAVTKKHNFSTEMKILIGVIGAAAIASTCVAAVLLLTSRRRQGRKLRTAWDFYPYIRLSLEEIKHATGDFSAENAIGSGVTGTVYKGILRNGTTLAFKKFNLDSSSIRSFMREIESVGSIRHRNLIRIFGYFSNQQDHDILILEYMPNGSLHDHLHSNKARESLSWEARLRVAIHVGEGLLYMHNDCPSPIIHCDLKPQNILFDANMEVRISDFGLAKMIADTASTSSFTENVRGTLGYMAPEVASSGHISRKCDVYSFGILLIELITGRKPFEEVHMQSEDGEDQSTTTLVRWVSVTLQSGGKILDIVDSEIRHACAESKEVIDQAQKLLNVAFHCTEENPNRRPEMQQVVRRVQSIAGYNTSAVEYHGDPEGPEVDGRSQAFDQK